MLADIMIQPVENSFRETQSTRQSLCELDKLITSILSAHHAPDLLSTAECCPDTTAVSLHEECSTLYAEALGSQGTCVERHALRTKTKSTDLGHW